MMPRNTSSSGIRASGTRLAAFLISAPSRPACSATPIARVTTRITPSTPLPKASQFCNSALSKIQRTCSDSYIGLMLWDTVAPPGPGTWNWCPPSRQAAKNVRTHSPANSKTGSGMRCPTRSSQATGPGREVGDASAESGMTGILRGQSCPFDRNGRSEAVSRRPRIPPATRQRSSRTGRPGTPRRSRRPGDERDPAHIAAA